MEAERQRLIKESSEKQRGRETAREDHSTEDSSTEVRKARSLVTPHRSSAVLKHSALDYFTSDVFTRLITGHV